MLCVDLAKEGFTNITGVDYCQEAIELARKVNFKKINNQLLFLGLEVNTKHAYSENHSRVF